MAILQSEVETRLDAIDREIRKLRADLPPKPPLFEPYKRWWQGPLLGSHRFLSRYINGRHPDADDDRDVSGATAMTTTYTFHCRWSEEDQAYVGTFEGMPSLSWLALEKRLALRGIVELVLLAEEDIENETTPDADV